MFPAAGQPEPGWTLPRTPDGQPDLQGAWSYATITPLERPSEYAGREVLTAEEVAARSEDAATRVSSQRRGDLTAQRDVDLAYDQFWWDPGTSDGRTSLIVDPPDGRIPFTPEGRQRIDARRFLRNCPAHGPEDRSPQERCIHHPKAGPPMSAGGYNNHLRLLQTPDYVAIVTEQIHDARIIPMDGRAPIPEGIRQWMGSSRGRWEGDTLVVETSHFNVLRNQHCYFDSYDRVRHSLDRRVLKHRANDCMRSTRGSTSSVRCLGTICRNPTIVFLAWRVSRFTTHSCFCARDDLPATIAP